MTPAAMRVFLQHGKALCKPDMRLIQLDDRNYVLASSPQMPVRKSRKIVDKSHVSEWQRADLLDQNLQGDLIISIVGRANLRRHEATRDPFMAQHQIREDAGLAEAPLAQRNVSASPMEWLAARNSRKSDSKNSRCVKFEEIELRAGSLFSRDFALAAAGGKLTMDWDKADYVDEGGKRSTDGMSQLALDARKRFDAATDYLGPGLSDVMRAVCCYEMGLEACEQHFQLPRRSAKLMIKLGLLRLSVFYGLQPASDAAASFRMRRTIA
jgi:hypothetical protein